jgi:hypothetical protein
MVTNVIDSCAERSLALNVFGVPVEDLAVSAAVAEDILSSQRHLIGQGLRGDETFLVTSRSSAVSNIERVGLLVARIELTAGDLPTVDAPEFDANLVPYEIEDPLDPRDMLSGAWMWNEPIGTCVLLKDRTILTSRHVFGTPNCSYLLQGNVFAVFGHSVRPDGQPKRAFTLNRDVFQVVPPATFQLASPREEDRVELELSDPENVLGGRPPVTVISPFNVKGDVYTLGHPNGLTLRYSRSRAIEPGIPDFPNNFRARLDAYPIASGSPVFEVGSDALIGIVMAGDLGSGRATVKGETRFVSRVCAPQDGSIVATLCLASDAFP